MSLTVNIYYMGKNGNARKFAEEMTLSGTVDLIRAEDAETVLLIDRWKDQEALDRHHKSNMMSKIAELRNKYGLHMKVERFTSEEK